MAAGTGFTLTARTSGIAVTSLSADFTTTSNGTYVDVTGLTYSVPNLYFVSARYDATKSTAGTGSCRLVYGATPTVAQTSATLTTSRRTKGFNIFQNTSGAAQTWKVQAQSTSDANTWTVHKDGTAPFGAGVAPTVLVVGPFAMESYYTTGTIEFPMKANITTITAFMMGAGTATIINGVSIPFFCDAVRSGTISNLVENITINATAVTYAEGGASTGSTLFGFFYDFTGDNVTLS